MPVRTGGSVGGTARGAGGAGGGLPPPPPRRPLRRRGGGAMSERILTARMEAHPRDSHTLERYLETGGYASLGRVVREMTPEQVTAEVQAANLRGRGGAGFPCGVKWGFLGSG